MITKEQEKQIKFHYEIALDLLLLNQIVKAKHELYNKMNKELYDVSLDLMDNRNMGNIKAKDLKALILEVHEMLVDSEENNEESDLNDNFNKLY